MRILYSLLVGLITTGSLTPMAWARATLRRDGAVIRLANGEVATTFNLANGDWEALYPDGVVFAANLRCTVAAGSDTANSVEGPSTFAFRRVQDGFGEGLNLEIDRGLKRAFKLSLTLYDQHPFFLVQARLPQARGLLIHQVTLPEGRLYAGEHLSNVCALVNYWTGEWYSEIHPVSFPPGRHSWETYSHFFAGAVNRADHKSVILGALYAQGVNRIELEANLDRDPRALFFQARCQYDKNPLLVESEAWESPPCFLGAPARPLDGLELYGAVAKALRPLPLNKPPPTGWCSWDAGASHSQAEFFANVDALKTNRLDEYGLQVVQLDDGWQKGFRCSGLWQPDERRFPAGMKGVADYIKSKGFTPGLWIGPFGEDGGQTNQAVLMAPGQSGGYDLASPAFKEFLDQTLRRIVIEWGFRYIKADFLRYGVTASRATPYDVSFREAVLSMMNVLQPFDGYLLACINHEWLTAGFADGQRLGNDVSGGRLTGLYPTLKNWPRRYFSNRNFWVGDPDMLHVNLPTEAQSQVWASFVALCGGSVMSGDNIPRLSASQIRILQKALPAQGLTARPVDLFDRPSGWSPKFPRLWRVRARQPGVGVWDVAGLFNWTVDNSPAPRFPLAEPQSITLDFSRDLDLPPGRRYLVFDFWRQEYLGAFAPALTVGLPPASCRVFAIQPEVDVPQVLGDDRHIICGMESLKQVQWDAGKRSLFGKIAVVKQVPCQMTVHIPPTLALTHAEANGQACEIVHLSPYEARLSWNSGPTGIGHWRLGFQPAAHPPEPTAASFLDPVTPTLPDPSQTEIPLRELPPLWTDQRHDIEGEAIAKNDLPHLGTIAPFWIAWDISAYAQTHPRLVTQCVSMGEGKTLFEIAGDGRSIYTSPPLGKGEQAPVALDLHGLRNLVFICHSLEGWFSSVRGQWQNPRLTHSP